jgi:hypothetical protein
MLVFRFGATLAASLAFAAGMTPAHAQPECTPGTLVQTSGDKQASGPATFMGLTATGDLMEVRSAGNGTWTIVLTLKDGSSCAVVSGDGWETVEPPANSLLERSNNRTRVD